MADLADPEAKAAIATLIHEVRADVVYADRCLAENIGNNARRLVPETEHNTLPDRAQAILKRFAVVDTLALRYRDCTYSTFIGLLVITFLAMLVLELCAHILPEFFHVGARLRLIFWLYPILWLSAW